MKRKTVIWILILAVIGSAIIFRMSNKNKVKDVAVKTAQVQQGDIKAYLSTTGTVKSKSSKDYYPLQGKVKKVNVKVGDSVTTGQVLVEYDVVDPNVAVKQAQIQYDNAVIAKQILVNNNNEIKKKIADIDKQISNLNSMISKIKESGAPSVDAAALQSQLTQLKQTREVLNSVYEATKDGDTAEVFNLSSTISEIDAQISEITKMLSSTGGTSVDVSTLEAQLAQLKQAKESLKTIPAEQLKQADNAIALAKLGLDSAKQNLSKSQDKIVADIDGVVTTLTAIEGTAAMAAQPAVTVQNIESLKVLVSVGKYDANRIRLDQEATVRSGDKELKAKVAAIDPAAKKSMSATGAETTLGVEIDILEKAESLKIDFDTDVDVLLGQVNNVAKVPAESIRTNKEGKTYIYTVENGRAVEREVKLGLQSDMEAQIVEGAKAGDKVILNPSENIKNGTAVKEAVGDEK